MADWCVGTFAETLDSWFVGGFVGWLGWLACLIGWFCWLLGLCVFVDLVGCIGLFGWCCWFADCLLYHVQFGFIFNMAQLQNESVAQGSHQSMVHTDFMMGCHAECEKC